MAERSGITPLMLACNGANMEATTILLDAGADANLADSSKHPGEGNWSALHYAVVLDEQTHAKRADIVGKLLRAGANPNHLDESGNTPLTKAAGSGQKEIVAKLLSAGANPSLASDAGGGPAIHWAANGGHDDVVLQLLAVGVDVDLRDPLGATSLMTAAYRGHERLVDLLLNYKADPSLADNHGRTALICAALYERTCFTNAEHQKALRIVKRLVHAGSPLLAKDRDGQTALAYASEAETQIVYEFLKQARTQP